MNVFPRLSESGRALVRSQAGPGAGLALAACPTCRITNLDSHLFRVLLLRRLQLPLPLTVRSCRCGHFLDAHGHHRAACARAGVLARRGFSVESVAARICREAGGRVTTNILVRDLDLALEDPGDARRLEVVVDGLPLHGGSHAVDTTLVSALRGDGSARAGADRRDGVALIAARRRKERRYPELVGRRARARLVVLAVEVGGRWSSETQNFLSLLAKARARDQNWLLRRRAEMAWRARWASLLACTVARAVASSFLELPQASGADGERGLAVFLG